jgi:carboxylesterase type B
MFNDKAFLGELLGNWNEILPHSFYYDHLDNSQQVAITSTLNEFYFGNETLSDETMSDSKGLIDMWTDGWFIGIFESLKYRFASGVRDNTFIYHFSHRTTASFSQARDFLGTCHVDDLVPLFSLRKSYYYSSVPTRHDRELTEKMTKMWTNFATFG